jgi:serine phosphatase RsbU (regulator of sigma subunit)
VAQWIIYWLGAALLVTTGYLTIMLLVLPRRLNIYQIVALILAAIVFAPVTIVVTLTTVTLLLTRSRDRYPHLGTLVVAVFLAACAAAILSLGTQVLAPRGVVAWALVPALFLVYFYLFPPGRLVPRSTRWLAILVGLPFLGPLFTAEEATRQSTPPQLPNVPLAHLAINVALLAGDAITVGILIIGIVPQLYVAYLRLDESGRVPRPRGGTLAAGVAAGVGGVVAAALIFTPVTGKLTPAPHILYIAVFLAVALPLVAAALALPRVRPYDGPALAYRALVYGALTAALIGVYFICVGVVSAGSFAVGSFAAGGLPPLAALVGVAAISALIRPLRLFLKRTVAERVFPRLFVVETHMTALGDALRDQVSLDILSDRLVAGVSAALQPDSVTLWLRGAPSLSGEAVRRLLPRYAPQARGAGRDAPDSPAWELEVGRHAGADAPPPETRALTVATDDPLRDVLPRGGGTLAADDLPAASPCGRALRARGAKLVQYFGDDGEIFGLLVLGPRAGGAGYSFDDREALDVLAERVSPTVRVALLLHEQDVEGRERERVDQELATARRIQQTLLPKVIPALSGWEIATHYQPARAVGGDFYDFLPFADGRLGLVLGDVTDKGVPAALVMATTRSMLRAAALDSATPGPVLARVNDLLYADLPASMFVTCFYAILDPATGHVIYANAGQDLPYLRRADGCVAELRATGMPLGLMPGMEYEEREDALALGDGVLFYSDGLVEAHDPAREMFGFPRLAELLAGTTLDRRVLEMLLGALATFTGPAWEQEDDVTLVTLRRYG